MHGHMQITCINSCEWNFNGKLNKSLGGAQADNMSSTYPLIQAANDFFFLPVANSGLIKVEKQMDAECWKLFFTVQLVQIHFGLSDSGSPC